MYSWIEGCILYMRLESIIQHCVREEEIYDILKACHDGPYRVHFTEKRIGYKLLHLRYYRPTIFHDAKEYVKRCDSFQRMGHPVQSDKMPLQT